MSPSTCIPPPHWNLFPFTPAQPNLLIAILLIASANKCQFAGQQRAREGRPGRRLAVSRGRHQPGGNEHCSAPTSLCFNWSSVDVGFTWGDLVASLLCFAFDSLKSFIEGKILRRAVRQAAQGPVQGPI